MKSWKECSRWENSVDESMEVDKGTLMTAAVYEAGEKTSNICKEGPG